MYYSMDKMDLEVNKNMHKIQISKKMESVMTVFMILSLTAFTLGQFLGYKFWGFLISFTFVSIVFILMSLPQYDVTYRRSDLEPKAKLIWNVVGKLIALTLLISSMSFVVIPYAMDIKPYLEKNLTVQKGPIEKIQISRNSKSVTSSVHINVNGVEVNFERMSSKSVEFFSDLKKGDFVELQYLPHSKFGIAIKK